VSINRTPKRGARRRAPEAKAKPMTVAQWVRLAERRPLPAPPIYACFATDIFAGKSGRSRKGPHRHNLTTTTAVGYTNAFDWLAKAMGMGPAFAFATATGNATSTTAVALVNTGAAFPTAGQGLAGQIVYAGPNSSGVGSVAYLVVTSNTATTLTGDQWTNPASTTGANTATPNGTCSYQIGPGQNPAAWLAVTSSVFTPATSDTTLAGELTVNGFGRAVGTYAHTAASNTYTLTHLWTATGTQTINNEAQFGAATVTAGGVMPFESPEPSPPTLVSGDTLQNTITITI
jgi:hypothetical protein